MKENGPFLLLNSCMNIVLIELVPISEYSVMVESFNSVKWKH